MLHEKWLKSAPTLAERTRRRVSLHLIPYLFFLYILAYLDRINVSVAALELKKPLSEGGMGWDNAIIGFGAGVFFWGYWILEIPSTVSVLKWGARWVFVRILILWGLCCTLIGFINTPFASSLFTWIPHIPEEAGWLASFINELPHNAEYQFYFFRFMLGFFEGGFFPSVIVYLSLWFRTEDRAKAIASFMAAIPLSSVIGAPLSGMLLVIDWLDMPGWRWIFIIQGIVPVLAGVVTLFFLPDRPEKAPWLPPEERDWLLGELDREHHGKQGHGHGHFLWVRHIWIVLLMTLAYFCLNVTSYGLSMFMPAILKSQAGSISNVWASVLTAAPFVVAFCAMLFNGWHSDHTKERIGHVAIPLAGLGCSILLAALFDGWTLIPVLIMIFLVGAFMYAHLPAYWPIPTMFLGSVAAASATGFINMVGNLGGFVGPMIVGTTVSGQESFAPALLKLAPLPMIGAAVVLLIGYYRRQHPMMKKGTEPTPGTGIVDSKTASEPVITKKVLEQGIQPKPGSEF